MRLEQEHRPTAWLKAMAGPRARAQEVRCEAAAGAEAHRSAATARRARAQEVLA